MKRRAHGVNLDDGVALSSAEDFDRLYVDARPEEDRRLRGWLADPKAEALILAGQIGTGKTTLLYDSLRLTPGPGVVRVEFDKAPLEETQGAFLAVLFGSLLTKALTFKCSLEGLGLALSDFGTAGRRGWQGLRELLLVAPESVVKAARVRAAYGVFDRNIQQTQKACAELISRIEDAIGASPSIIAEGVDKFVTSSPGYFSLAEVLDFLSEYKSLYEANAVHLFDSGRAWVASQKLFIGPLADETLLAMYDKRLGSYAALYRDSFQMLVQFSGGNPRQALRLLNAYYFYRTKSSVDDASALAKAAHRVTQDLLQLGFARFPADMLAIFKRDGYAEGSVLARPETAPDARDILYHNWAFIRSTPAAGTTRWPLFINPLVSDAVMWEKGATEPPELAAVRRWARDHQVSPMGLSMPEDETGRPRDWRQVWEQLSSSESSRDELNIVRLLEEVGSSLFSANRQDRVMVSYRDSHNLSLALDYLIAKAATYGPFQCHEIHLAGGEDADPVAQLMAEVKERDDATIYAVFMEGPWTSRQLDALERLRDRFTDVQMLWFVEHAALLRYLPHWPQFRQLLRFYVFEDDFLAPLSPQEIEADLAVLREVGGARNGSIRRFRRILNYLKRREVAA
jgi:hypothetical protein